MMIWLILSVLYFSILFNDEISQLALHEKAYWAWIIFKALAGTGFLIAIWFSNREGLRGKNICRD